MKIAVNTRLLLSGKMDGIGKFTYESFSLLVAQHPEVEFYFLYDRPSGIEIIESKNVSNIFLSPVTRHPWLLQWWLNISVKRWLAKNKIDLFISPDGWMPDKPNCKSLTIIHDLNFYHYPQKLRWGWGTWYNRKFKDYATHASRVATVSEFSKNDMATVYNIPTHKIDVVYNGADIRFIPLNTTDKTNVKKQYSKGEDYFFFIGSLYERKNIARMLLAFDAFKKQSNSKIKFVIAGRAIWWSNETKNLFDSLQYKEDVIFTNRVTNQELYRLMASAHALVYVSLFEGFGIPIIEAMQCGVPVITSNVTSMPEVAGDAALLVNPNHVDEIATAMETLTTNNNLRNNLIEAGTKQASLFSWQRTATLMWDSIQKTLH